MTEEQVKQLSQELSDEELNELASGQMSPETKKKIWTYVGAGVGGAAALTGLGIGAAAIIGWQTGKGAFGYLHTSSNSGTQTPTSGDDVELEDL